MAEDNPTPLDAERERLRKAGYSDAEISQILVQRAVGGGLQQPAGTAPGAMTGVLANASAVLSHAKGTIPAIQSNIANVSNPAAPRASRAKSAVVVAFAAVLVAFLGYTVLLEWYQHVVYPTQMGGGQVKQLYANPNLTAADRARGDELTKRKCTEDD